MSNFTKPNVFCSRCLGFEKCRWNGEMIPDRFVGSLKKHVKFVTACPEAEIGLGIPRDPIRIVFRDDKFKLMQLNTGKDVTSRMKIYASEMMSGLHDIDGFILKDRSPSCGIKDVKVYPGLEPSGVIKKSSGFFAQEVLKSYGHLAVETEGRLTNLPLREHFLTKVYTMAAFRKIQTTAAMKDLVEFHTRNKFLLMAYSQKEMRQMGKVVANHEKNKPPVVYVDYQRSLSRALATPPKYTANINVMMHALGYFSKELSADEKRFFLNTLEEYRREQAPLSVPVGILRAFVVRFDEKYLKDQSFFEPYPQELVALKDSGKGRSK